jgi:sugar transferase (PEP-CTERM system associated)
MFSLFQRNLSGSTLFQLGAEGLWVFVAVILALKFHGQLAAPVLNAGAPAFAFAVLIVCLNGAFGLYRRDAKIPFGSNVTRMFLALLIGVPIAYLVARILPGGDHFNDTLGEAVLFAFTGLIIVRHLIVPPIVRTLLPRRVLVLGTGPEARMVEASLATADPPGVELVGFYALEKVEQTTVSPSRVVARIGLLEDTVKRLRVNEIIVAVRQQRGGVLPLRSLLECRLNGVQVTDLARFFERVHGHVPIELLKASWLIYGNGFRQTWIRSLVKRVFDLVVATTLLVLTLPIMAITALLIAIESGAPVIYRQDRVGHHGKPFAVLKFRSMRMDAEKDGQPEWAAMDDARVTALGRFLRHSRIDELPQLINVLKGEMSFVGPRPERPVFVKLLTEQIPFYAVRHSVKPGITGWAQVRYSYGATVEQSLKKLEYDLYYVKNHTLFLDLLILLETVRVVLLGEGAR